MDLNSILRGSNLLWVFGYGSLIWKPDFTYSRKEVGYITGYKRRLWQGNTTHRGTDERPGRVATLIPAKEKSRVWGVAYEVVGEDAIMKALGGLTVREITLGGYCLEQIDFRSRASLHETRQAIVYMATAENKLFLGGCDMHTMALDIFLSRGFAGPNIDYVTQLVDYIREYIPEDKDRHLFEIDRRLRELTLNNCLSTIICDTNEQPTEYAADDTLHLHSPRKSSTQDSYIVEE